MNKSTGPSWRRLAIGGLVLAAVMAAVGCETHVVSREGIGASSAYPDAEQRAGSDPLSKRVWGEH
ncbi:MAG: hypothetical protein IT430_09705 [Phycisphaerales bacterium]|nr:hypothetical protein [Phycisphaerales bacterium]